MKLLPKGFFCIALTACLNAYSQVEKGDSNLGINTMVSSLVGVNSPNSNGFISLSYQYYFTNSISLGAGPFYLFSTSKQETPDIQSESWSSTFGLNAFFNYSFLTTSAKSLPYLGLQYTYQLTYSGNETQVLGSFQGSWQDVINSSIGANAGIKFFLTERVNLDANLSYTSVIFTSIESGSGYQEIEPEGGLLQFSLGLGIILGKQR